MAKGRKGKTGPKGRINARERKTMGSSSNEINGRPSYDSRETTTFTLRDAARAQHGQPVWSTSLNLRHRSIGFVRSTGPSPSETVANELIEQDAASTVIQHQDSQTSSRHCAAALDPEEHHPRIPKTTPANFPVPTLHRSPASVSSNASDEVVLFGGRINQDLGQSYKSRAQEMPHDSSKGMRIKQDPYEGIASANVDPPLSSCVTTTSTTQSKTSQDIKTVGSSIADSQVRHGNKRGTTVRHRHSMALAGAAHRNRGQESELESESDSESELQADLDDYVINMREHGFLNETAGGILRRNGQDDHDGWNSADLHDFDDMSTSDGVLGSVQQIISRRSRPGGLQYLVVWDGATVDDARWVTSESLAMQGAANIISMFELQERTSERSLPDPAAGSFGNKDPLDNSNRSGNGGDSSEDDNGVETSGEISISDEDSDDDISEDERDLIERRTARLSDEKLARLLAKQEELGLGSTELVLYDGMFADDLDQGEDSDVELQLALAANRRRTLQRQGRSKRRLEFVSGYDEVMLFGDDDYGAFDVMDRERPSIDGHSKDKGDPTLWGLSDSEQASVLRQAWASDRAKKKIKKQEREELRTQGLLGKKNKFKPDLRAKYRDGMDVDQLGEELRGFLFSTAESQALPPMDKRDRKAIHEIVSAFGLKSFSKGSGRTRFTTLQKTSKTVEFDEKVFDRLRGRLVRRFYSRMDHVSRVGRAGGHGKPGGSGAIGSDFRYRDGEVVGGTAPEIGSDNRGRAMLEKMGWSTGNALGAIDNKGILQPIAHVVRSSRAGLG